MNPSKSWMKVVFIIVLLLILLPLALLVLVQFAQPKEAPAQGEVGIADSSKTGSVKVRTRQARQENRAAKQETTLIEPEPEQNFEGVGAVVPNAPRSKQATPYRPGTVPGDSGVTVQYAGSPDDMVSGPVSPPEGDLWGGRSMPPIPPENMRGIGGVRIIDPNDPFFQQEIPNPFTNQ
jgi:hypothetical protein